MARALMALTLAVMPLAAFGQSVEDCSVFPGYETTILQPASQNLRLFANGAVTLAVFGKRQAGGLHLLLMSPPFDDMGIYQCRVVSGPVEAGFTNLDLVGTQASYDPAKGLQFEIPVQSNAPDRSDLPSAKLTVTLNQATGEITAAVRD
jgi:hypothetical protein